LLAHALSAKANSRLKGRVVRIISSC